MSFWNSSMISVDSDWMPELSTIKKQITQGQGSGKLNGAWPNQLNRYQSMLLDLDCWPINYCLILPIISVVTIQFAFGIFQIFWGICCYFPEWIRRYDNIRSNLPNIGKNLNFREDHIFSTCNLATKGMTNN